MFFNFFLSASAEEVPAGYVAKWETVLLNEKDFIDNNSERCTSFSGVLSKGKIEQPQILGQYLKNLEETWALQVWLHISLTKLE